MSQINLNLRDSAIADKVLEILHRKRNLNLKEFGDLLAILWWVIDKSEHGIESITIDEPIGLRPIHRNKNNGEETETDRPGELETTGEGE